MRGKSPTIMEPVREAFTLPCWQRNRRHEKSRPVMTAFEIKGDWNITKGKLKEKWAQLTENDLQYVDGKLEELYGRIQKRTGETRKTIEKAVRNYNDSPDI